MKLIAAFLALCACACGPSRSEHARITALERDVRDLSRAVHDLAEASIKTSGAIEKNSDAISRTIDSVSILMDSVRVVATLKKPARASTVNWLEGWQAQGSGDNPQYLEQLAANPQFARDEAKAGRGKEWYLSPWKRGPCIEGSKEGVAQEGKPTEWISVCSGDKWYPLKESK